MFKVIIAGGRDFSDYDLLRAKCDFYLSKKAEIEIVSGVANGADKLGEKYAFEKGYPLKRFPADWVGLGKRAGYTRNIQMAEYADALILFWDGISKGSHHMLKTARNNGLLVKVVSYRKMPHF